MNRSVGELLIAYLHPVRTCLRLVVFPNALHQSNVVNSQAWRLTVIGKTSLIAFIGKLNFLGSMCLRSPHVTVFCTLPLGSCALFPFSYSCSNTCDFLKMMNFFRNHFLFFIVDFLDHQRCGRRLRPALPFASVPIISFILRADSAFPTAIFAFHFRPVIMEGWAFFSCGSRESRSIWKSHSLPNLNSSTSDNVGSFSFVDELYCATFVNELETLNHFFVYWQINRSIVSTFVIDTSYTCIGHGNLGNNPK